MVGLLIMTHETLGQAYTQLAEHFFGAVPDNVRIMGVNRQEQPEVLVERAQKMVRELGGNNGVLMLTDIFGATPCNTAQKLIHDDTVVVVAGLNAPMMVKAMQYAANRTDVRELADEVCQAAINGIMIVDCNGVRGGHA